MRRRWIAAAVLAGTLAFTVARCDRRLPGEAAVANPEEVLSGGVVRRDVRFACGDSVCAAWLYLPTDRRAAPVVVMAHGFAGTRDVALGRFAEHFAHAGLAALVFDYRHFGASGGLPRQIVDPWRQLDDWRAALAFARAQPDLDPERVAAWGSSMGAANALLIAAEDSGLAAVVAQAPLIDTGLDGEAASHGAARVARMLFTAWADFAASAWNADPITIAAIARADGFGMIADDRAYAAFESLVTTDSTYRNAVAARSIFLFDDYNPAPKLKSIIAPVLLIASRTDRFAPYAAAQAYAARAGNVSLVSFEGDHFDVYASPAADVAAEAAARFLTQHLGQESRAR